MSRGHTVPSDEVLVNRADLADLLSDYWKFCDPGDEELSAHAVRLGEALGEELA